MEKPISIKVTKSDKSPQGKRYKQFNSLINKINKLKVEYDLLQEQVRSGLVFFHAEIRPLQEKQQDLLVQEVKALHQLYPHQLFSRKDREKIAHMIVSHCSDLFQTGRDFEELTEIYNTHSGSTREDFEAEQKQVTAEMAEEMLRDFGIDIELDPDDDIEQIMEKAQAAAESKRLEEEAKSERPKTEKQRLKEERERKREKDIQKVSKNIYNELVKLLHPDREMDEAKKLEKTEAIQRVNEAYERNDLYALLNLQAEFLNKQGDELALMPDKEFKYYLEVLKAQEQELLYQFDTLGMVPGYEGYVYQNLCHPNPITMRSLRLKAVKEEKEGLKSYQHNLSLTKNAKILKDALQHFEIEEDDFSFSFFMEDELPFFPEMEQRKTKKKKK
jgi:hypothetical protein